MAVGLLPVGALPVGRAAQSAFAAERAASAQPASAEAESSTAASEDEALALAKRLGKKVEVLSQRGESSDLYATPEGELESREYMRPVRTRVDGEWRPIDPSLAVVGTGTNKGMVAPKAVSVGLTFSGGGTGPLVRLERAGRTFQLSWPGTVPAPRLDGDTATYPDILPDVDLRLAARSEGFTQLLVVKSAEAAQSEELAELRLKLSTEGLVARETANGGLEAVDEGGGGVVFEAPRPVMWDSSPATQEQSQGTGANLASVPATAESARAETSPATSRRAETVQAAQTAQGAEAAGEPGAGDSGRLEPVGVDIAAGGDELVLTPDRELLTGPDTVYPVFIDPQMETPRATAWTVASRYWDSSPQWKFNGDPDAGLGYCGWNYCAPQDVKRLFYQVPTTKYAGRSIIKAEFTVRETHAASCQPREVQLWRTKGINSSTTWNTQNASGFWIDRIETRSFAYGFDGCASADAEFNVKDVVAQAAANKWPTITFGMRASDEDDRYTWKRFSDAAYLRVTYNRPPPRISTSRLIMDPGGPCMTSAGAVRIRSRATIKATAVTDPDNEGVSVQFRARWDSGNWLSARSTTKPSGHGFSITLPTTVPTDKLIAWEARVWDGQNGDNGSGQWSPWSSQGAHSCYFRYDLGVPAGPSITSAQYPRGDDSDPNDPWWDGVGRYGTFTIDAPDPDVTKYWIGINGSPSSKYTLTTTGGAARTIKMMPTRPGPNFIMAKAWDSAGNASEPRTYHFRVRSGQPDRLSWQLDEGAGASQVTGAGGEWPATINGVRTGAEGVSGTGLELDGVDDYAATDSPVLNTGKSFSVSVWAKLPSDLPTSGTVAVAQSGANTSGFEIYYSTALGGWVFLRHSADASGGSAARAVQPACSAGDTTCLESRLNTWTHLVGVFDNVNHVMKLYVDGGLVGTAPFTEPWDARGRTFLGAASHYGTIENFFKGSLDEFQLFDYQLEDAQVTRLHERNPVDTGRPAKLVFPLDEKADAVALTGRAQPVAAQLRGGTALGADGVNGRAVEFDGVDDYLTAGRPVMDTYQSFAVSTWVKLPKDKESRAMTAVAQSSANVAGFELYHSTAQGGWVFLRHSADASNATPVRAIQTACPANSNCAAARLGQWNHVVGVYDIDASEIRLYVNGVLTATTSYTTPWLATGEVTLGAAKGASGLISPLKGAMDDVRLYDRAISDDEVRQLFKQRSLVKSRWKFESASTAATPVTPDAGPVGAGLGLYNGAKIGPPSWVDGDLILNGVNQYAATAAGTVPLETEASFTVSAFAQAAATPTGSVALLSAPGTNKDAFSVRYIPSATPGTDGGRWRITTADADKTDAASADVENGQFYSPRDWTHLALVYDGFAHEMRLYVNGQLEEVACKDTDEDGEPDVAGCTDQVSSAENVLTFKAVQSLQLGRDRAGGYWPGSVSDVWTFQGALNELQIGHLATGQPGADTTVPGND
ncbi:LamG-like jellyroll fold domain-containing protein [Streptomyces sp. NPDC020898]|uniref:LamG-like jellyroll fold domain-containing protein n=1 Tax=Streptomyces sp. NPDC020898 TaxID=3365101 RepID=UPI0037AC753D